jgi:hypothetical protein
LINIGFEEGIYDLNAGNLVKDVQKACR